MGAGLYGGFGATLGIRATSMYKPKRFTPVSFKGTVKVEGVERDVSRRVYQRNDINFHRIDKDTGETNLQRMLRGVAPIGRDGKPIELHHILQKEVGSMVEIHETTHREYKRILHGLRGDGESFRNDKILDSQYRLFKRLYWKWRAQTYLGGNNNGFKRL